MMVQRSVILLLLVLLVLVGCGDDEPEISSVEDLKDTDAKNIIWKKDGAKMVLIPEAVFREKDTYDKLGDLVPGKVVEVLDPIYMDTTEVTVGQFKKFLKDSGYEPEKPIDWDKLYKYSPTDDYPMIYVSWFDVTAYCKWAGKRLPTEKEWEFAARGGLVDKVYSWGDDEAVHRDYAHVCCYGERGGVKSQWDETTAPVGSLKPNGYGLYDMAGNVWEWCQDLSSGGDRNKEYRVVRGGGWGLHDFLGTLRVATRSGRPSSYVDAWAHAPSYDGDAYRIGFRCVVDVEE